MRHRGATTARDDTGAAAVEFALVSIPLLILLVAIIQFSLWLWAFQVGSHAAREGARAAAVDPCNETLIDTRVIDRVGSAAQGSFGASDVDVTHPGSPDVGDEVTVALDFEPFVIGPFDGIIPDVQREATARIEYIPEGSC